jgi:hypothetical protein
VSRDRDVAEIIHGGAFQAPVVEHETAWLDDIDGDVEAGAETQNRTRILRNIGFVEGQPHGRTLETDSSPWQAPRAARRLGFQPFVRQDVA